MSTELIVTLVGGVAALVAAIAVPVWLLLHGEQRRKSLLPKIEITYFTLKAFVAAHKSRTDNSTSLNYDQLYQQIVEDCNIHTPGGNFDPSRKNNKLDSYTHDSINKLHKPKSQTLGPLIEPLEGAYKVTTLGLNIFSSLPSERSECARTLNEYLRGSLDLHSTKSSRVADQATSSRAPMRPSTPDEWRYAVFMSIPEGDPLERQELNSQVSQKLSPSGLTSSTRDKVDQALTWNLNNDNLTPEPDGRIRLATPKASKTLDDFK